MNAQTLLKANEARLEALEEKAEAVVKAIEASAGPMAEMLEGRATALAKSIGETAGPLAEALGAKAEEIAELIEEKVEQAAEEVKRSLPKEIKFGAREALFLGLGLGLVGVVWVSRRIDREVAKQRLRTAGSRVGETTRVIGSRVGETAQGLGGRVGELAGPAGERLSQVVSTVKERASEVVQQVREQSEHSADVAVEHFSDVSERAREAASRLTVSSDEPGAGLSSETRAAIDDVVTEAEQVVEQATEQATEQAGAVKVSNGMKVVDLDGVDIGRVQEVREDVFVLNRPKGSDLLVPLDEVARIEGTIVYLRVEADRVMKMGWRSE